MCFILVKIVPWEKQKRALIAKNCDDDEEVKTVLTNNQNNNYFYNVVSDSKSDNEAKENIFVDQADD